MAISRVGVPKTELTFDTAESRFVLEMGMLGFHWNSAGTQQIPADPDPSACRAPAATSRELAGII